MRSKYEHIFFDLDHTLWDFEVNSRETLEELFGEFDLPSRTRTAFEQFYQKYRYYNRLMWMEYELGRLTKEQLRTDRFEKALLSAGIHDIGLSAAFGDAYLARCPHKTALVPYAIEVMEHVLSKGYRLHIITNGFEEVQHVKLAKSGIGKYVEFMITSEQAGVKKPSIGIFHHAFSLTGATARNSIIIGDSYHSDIAGGLQVGMDTIFFNPEKQTYTKRPTHDISCLSEILTIL